MKNTEHIISFQCRECLICCHIDLRIQCWLNCTNLFEDEKGVGRGEGRVDVLTPSLTLNQNNNSK